MYRTLSSPQGGRIILDGREVINMASNNYLGLANHPDVVAAAKNAIDKYGVATTASRNICGNYPVHDKVLEIFADEKNYPIYFHCAVGADRTGTIGMYLDTILGMSSEDILLNYNFTSLASDLTRSWYHTSDCLGLGQYLEEIMPDKTIAERLMINLKKSCRKT